MTTRPPDAPAPQALPAPQTLPAPQALPAPLTLHDQVAALPRLDAVAPQPQVSGLGYWARVASGRHAAAAVVAVPLLFWAYAGAVGRPLPGGSGTLVTLALAAVLGGLTLATYVPPRARGRETDGQRWAATACAAGPILPVMFATLLFESAATSPFNGVLAVGLVGFGLAQRVLGSPTCPA